MLQTAAKLFGAVLLLIGVFGFIPALTPDGHLLGVFHVDTLHNIVHLASGTVALAAGYSSTLASRRYFQIFGVVYALVAILGIYYGEDDILGLMANNMADVFLHIAIAGTALWLGFMGKDGEVDSPAV